MLCYKTGIFPSLDVAAGQNNTKCKQWESDALNQEWHRITYDGNPNPYCDVWCNPPHSKTEEFVRRATKQWVKHNLNILMIIPANSICTKYAEECIEPHAEYHPIFFRPKFLKNGEEKDPSRNSYFYVVWRKK